MNLIELFTILLLTAPVLGFFVAGCHCCEPEESPCEECCAAAEMAGTHVVDFGVGGWTDGLFCDDCDLFVGELHFAQIAGECRWQRVLTPFSAATLEIVSSGGNCHWLVSAIACVGGGQESASYESTPVAAASFDCTAFPVTLTKTSEGGTGCGGTLPATIALES